MATSDRVYTLHFQERNCKAQGSFALGDDDKVDLWWRSRFSFALDDDDFIMMTTLSLYQYNSNSSHSWWRCPGSIWSSSPSMNSPIGYHTTYFLKSTLSSSSSSPSANEPSKKNMLMDLYYSRHNGDCLLIVHGNFEKTVFFGANFCLRKPDRLKYFTSVGGRTIFVDELFCLKYRKSWPLLSPVLKINLKSHSTTCLF